MISSRGKVSCNCYNAELSDFIFKTIPFTNSSILHWNKSLTAWRITIQGAGHGKFISQRSELHRADYAWRYSHHARLPKCEAGRERRPQANL